MVLALFNALPRFIDKELFQFLPLTPSIQKFNFFPPPPIIM